MAKRKASAKQRAAAFHNGNSPHKDVEDMERTMELVGHYWNRGYTHFQIIDKVFEERRIKLSQPTIAGYVKTLKKRWMEASMEDRALHVQQRLAQLTDLKREAWDAYELSKKGERTVTKEYAAPLKLRDAAEKLGAGRDGDRPEEGGEKKLKLLRKQIKETGKLPANQFLQTVLACLQMECELLGLYAPKEATFTVGGGDGKKVLDWTSHAASLPPARSIEADLARLREEMGIEDAEVVEKSE